MRLSANLGSKNLKTGVQNGPKLKRRSGTQEGHLVVLEYRLAQMWGTARGLLNWDKPYIFLFFRDKDAWSANRHFPSADWHFSGADWHKREARPEGFWIEINLTIFDFLEIRTRSSSYSDHSANFSKHSNLYK